MERAAMLGLLTAASHNNMENGAGLAQNLSPGHVPQCCLQNLLYLCLPEILKERQIWSKTIAAEIDAKEVDTLFWRCSTTQLKEVKCLQTL